MILLWQSIGEIYLSLTLICSCVENQCFLQAEPDGFQMYISSSLVLLPAL